MEGVESVRLRALQVGGAGKVVGGAGGGVVRDSVGQG